MCLGVPGKVISISGEDLARSGLVAFAGIQKEVSLALVPAAVPGDFVIVHVGYAIAVLDQKSAEQTLALLDEIEREGLNDAVR